MDGGKETTTSEGTAIIILNADEENSWKTWTTAGQKGRRGRRSSRNKIQITWHIKKINVKQLQKNNNYFYTVFITIVKNAIRYLLANRQADVHDQILAYILDSILGTHIQGLFICPL